MIIVCPECSAKFAVKTDLIGTEGRKVRCAKCKHDWFQKPDEKALGELAAANIHEEPKEAKPIPEGSNVPAVKAAKAPMPLKVAFACVAVLFAFTMSIINANNILPGMSSYYGMLGIHDSKGFALYDIKVKKVESDKYNDLLVSGKIMNESEDKKYLPDVRLTIYNKDKEALKTITLDSQGAVVEPGQGIDFQNKIQRIPNESETVVMDLGNSLDLAAR